ncbi:CRISPR/Cas system-associated endoribonuclease Cas2 [Anoxybacillus eryuanensis]
MLMKCLNEIDQIIDEDEDSIYIYEVANPKSIKKQVFGQEKNFDELFL